MAGLRQLSWFDDEEEVAPVRPSSGLRYYQEDAAEAAELSLAANRSTLIVMATGLGKTQVFCELARRTPGHVLVLAHRDELVEQARNRLELMTGEAVEIEKADWYASTHCRLVVGSIDTVRQEGRRKRLGRDRFQLIIVDEAHHAAAKTWKEILNWFEGAKILGVTATPDRKDAKALNQVFDEVAYVCDIEDGIRFGYLVPIVGRYVQIEGLDLSEVKAPRGDLAVGQLDEAVVKVCDAIVHEAIRLEPNRRGIFFWPGVKSARYAMERANIIRPGASCYIDGNTPTDERRQIVRDFKDGRYLYLHNCQVATEGFDAPLVDMIVMGRPTTSRALYAQMCGRGTRVLPGLVEAIEGVDGAEDRRIAIAQSIKPNMVILDCVGNSGKHSLVTSADILGGRYTDNERARARKKLEAAKGTLNVQEALEAARNELRELAAKQKAQVSSRVSRFDPFKTLGIDPDTVAAIESTMGHVPATQPQIDALKRAGVADHDLARVSKAMASRLLNTMAKRRSLGLATLKQLNHLQRFGVQKKNLSFTRARAALDYVAKTNWGRSQPVDGKVLDEIIHAKRIPGED